MKKRLLIFLTAIWFSAGPALGQDFMPGNITASSADCATAGSCVTHQLGRNSATVSVVLGGTWVGTEQFEVTADGTRWEARKGNPIAGGAAVSSATVPGTWSFSVAGMTRFRVRGSAYTSGTVTVRITSSPAFAQIAELNCSVVWAVKDPRCYDGATSGAQIAAAFADLPSSKGTVDARGITANLTLASTLAIPTAGTLLVGTQNTLTCTITNGTPCITMAASSALICDGNAINVCKIQLAASGNVSSILQNVQTSQQNNIQVRGIELSNEAGGTVTNALMDFADLYDSSFYDVAVNYFSGKGLWIHDITGAGKGVNSLQFYNFNTNGNYNAGARPIVIEQNFTEGVSGVQFFGGDLGHPGAGQNLIEINGQGNTGLFNVYFFGFYAENSDATTALIKIVDAWNISFNGFMGNLGTGTTAYGWTIQETVSGRTDGITIVNGAMTRSGGTNNLIDNQVDSTQSVTPSRNVPFYTFLTPNLSTGPIHIGKVKVDRDGVLTPPGGVAAAGGYSTSCRNIAVGGLVPAVSTDFTDATPVVGAGVAETYMSEVFVAANCTATGVALFNGSNVTGNVIVAIVNAGTAQTPLKNSALAGTAGSGADAYQLIPFTATIALKGPATYFILTQYSSATARYNSPPLGAFATGKKTGETFGTLTTYTTPTTNVANLGNIASLY